MKRLIQSVGRKTVVDGSEKTKLGRLGGRSDYDVEGLSQQISLNTENFGENNE